MKKLITSILAIIIVSLLITIAPSQVQAQSKQEVLTNTKVIELVRLGLAEKIIIEKIRQTETQFDTSVDGLAKLKAAKVSSEIIMAMLNPSSDNESNSQTTNRADNLNSAVQTKSITAGEASLLRQVKEPGIYLLDNGTLKQFEPSIFSGTKANFLMGALTYGIKKTKLRAKVRGGAANMQISNSNPEFYFVFNPEYANSGAVMAGTLFLGTPATSPAEFVLVQMKQKKSSREAVLGEYGLLSGAEMGARDEDIREYSFEKIQPGIYKVVPKAELEAGEYCFYYAGNVTGIGFAGGKVFDFGVAK